MQNLFWGNKVYRPLSFPFQAKSTAYYYDKKYDPGFVTKYSNFIPTKIRNRDYYSELDL